MRDRNIEFRRWRIERDTVALVMSVEVLKLMTRDTIPMPQIIAQNTGDFPGAFLLNWVLNSVMEVMPPFDRMPARGRLMLNAAITLGVVIAFETLPLFNTPDMQDIPAAVLGVLSSLGVRKFAERWIRKQVSGYEVANIRSEHSLSL